MRDRMLTHVEVESVKCNLTLGSERKIEGGGTSARAKGLGEGT